MAGRIAHIAACAIGLMMLLSVPIQRPHRFTDHFRGPEVRRSIERHTKIAPPESGPENRIQFDVLRRLAAPVDDEAEIKALPDFDPVPQVPLTRLLLRLKLASSRAGAQDPLP